MSNTNNQNERTKNSSLPKRKINIYRCVSWGLGAAIILVCAIIIVSVIVKKSSQNVQDDLLVVENASLEQFLQNDNVIDQIDNEIEDINKEDATASDKTTTEEVSEETGVQSDSEEDENISEEDSIDDNSVNTSVDLSNPTSIIANWETIPAGTIIDAAVIDFNNLSQYFVTYEISEEVFSFINGKSYQDNPDVALSDLRYMKLLHYNFNHELQVGELIVAADLQSDFIGIFTELFQAEYEIQSMYLPDNYWTGDPTTTDSASIDVNNTSCFMYRPATGSGNLSKHAYGRAIDINPQQNPYVSYTSGSPVWSHENANDYIDRTTGLPHVITEEDICYQIFTKYGFTWGGSWTNIKDYQHFQK